LPRPYAFSLGVLSVTVKFFSRINSRSFGIGGWWHFSQVDVVEIGGGQTEDRLAEMILKRDGQIEARATDVFILNATIAPPLCP
jgi:hypothetical protein